MGIYWWIWNYAQRLTDYWRGALLFFEVIHQISRPHRLKNRLFESNLSKITTPVAGIKSLRFALFQLQCVKCRWYHCDVCNNLVSPKSFHCTHKWHINARQTFLIQLNQHISTMPFRWLNKVDAAGLEELVIMWWWWWWQQRQRVNCRQGVQECLNFQYFA